MTQLLNPTKTDKDIQDFFHQYAAESLKNLDQEVSEALKRRQIPRSKIRPLKKIYKISLKLGDNMLLNLIQKPILQQIDAAAYFIRDFQIGVLGQETNIFQLYEVEIQIDQNVKNYFIFESGKLLIQIPYWQMLFLSRYIPYQEIKTRWQRGEHLSKVSPVRRVWWLFNPIGDFRSNLRTMLLLAVQKHILGIDKLFVKFGLVEDSEHQSLSLKNEERENQSFKENVIPWAVRVRDSSALAQATIALLKQTVNEDKLGVNLELVLNNQDEAILVRLLDLFKNNLADPSQMEELIDVGTLSLQEVIHEEQSKVEIKMLGFVNIGNYHRIDVAVNLSAGYLKKYVELVPRKAAVKAILFGFVNVYTIDDFTVKSNFSGGMKINFETAALERALRELQLIG
jgi:hypothetical protein